MSPTVKAVEQIHELLKEMRAEQREQGEHIHRIEIQTTKTNGLVAEAFRQIEAHDIEFRDVKKLIDGIERRSAPAAAVVGEPKSNDAIRLEIPRALWAKAGALVGTLAVLMPPLVAKAKAIVIAWLGGQ